MKNSDITAFVVAMSTLEIIAAKELIGVDMYVYYLMIKSSHGSLNSTCELWRHYFSKGKFVTAAKYEALALTLQGSPQI